MQACTRAGAVGLGDHAAAPPRRGRWTRLSLPLITGVRPKSTPWGVPGARHLQRPSLRDAAPRGRAAHRGGQVRPSRDRGAGGAPGARRNGGRGLGLHRSAHLRSAARAPAKPRHRLRGGDCGAAAHRRTRVGRHAGVPARGGQRSHRSCRSRPRADRQGRAVPRIPQTMIHPRVDKLLDRTDSHYAAVVVAAKRARQLNSYYRALGEGSYEEYTPPMVETRSGNYLTIALEELAGGKIKYRYRA